MRNRYPGYCYRCGEHVAASAGHFEKVPHTSRWRVQHAECAIKFRGTDGAFAQKPRTRETEKPKKEVAGRLNSPAD